MLYRETQNTVKQGAALPKIIGCIFALMLLSVTGFANPQLDLSNPTSFFTNVASRFLADMNVDLHHIQIYPTNQYTPAVHRLLQLSANLYDATTNRFIGGGPTNYPTVFRPIFGSENGIVWIAGYQEVTDDTPALNFQYRDAASVAMTPGIFGGINIYGVPWIIGAKKGFPNFNEFSIYNPLTVSRELLFSNAVAQPPWVTNQLYDLVITNTFGIEAWNSYTNAYGRSLRLICSNTMSINITNELGVSLLSATNLPFGVDTNFTGWQGWTERIFDSSFKVPLAFSLNFTNGVYGRDLSFHPLNPVYWAAQFQPHLWMSLQFKLQFVLIDTSVSPHRVVDFVNLASVQPPVDIAATLDNGANGSENMTSDDAQWDTNFLNGTSGVSWGVHNQIEVGQFNIQNRPDFGTTFSDKQRAQIFRERLLGFNTNYFECPYFSHRVINQMISWQANDPLIHYMIADLTTTNGPLLNYNQVTVAPLRGPSTTNLYNLNFAYQPWGGYHLPGGGPLSGFGANPFDHDVRVKDAGLQKSDDWDFPSGEPLSFEWLGRVHRGTPWQTVFLKSSNQTVDQWRSWIHDTITNNVPLPFGDAGFSHPTNDWRIASLWARWVNTNDLSTLLSINNPDTNAWAARLDGLTALTNSALSELDPITITSNSPQAGIIAQAIQTTRVALPNNIYHDVGDILATPQLSVTSPFLNTVGMTNTPFANGITDEAFEKIPTQLLPLLRADSIGQIVPASGQLKMSFSGYDGHAYEIEASSNLTDWVVISSNSPSDGTFEITNTPSSEQQFYRSVVLH